MSEQLMGGGASLTPYCSHLFEWYNQRAYKLLEKGIKRPDRWKLALGCVVFGDKYVKRFLRFCVPSLRAEGNIPAIADAAWLMICTDEKSLPALQKGLQPLAELGVRITYDMIPDAIVGKVAGKVDNKYWLLSAVNNIQMQQAKYEGYGYSMLMPDLIYSENYFRNVKRLAQNHDAIVQGALSSKEEFIETQIPETDVLSIPNDELNAMGLSAVHDTYAQHMMNGRDYREDCPVHTLMLYVSQKGVHLMCPHLTPTYLSHRILLGVSPRLFNTIDSQLPFLIPGPAYCPTPQDDMNYLEVSSQDKEGVKAESVDLWSFCIRYWMLVYCVDGFLQYLEMDNILPLPDGFQSPYGVMDSKEVEGILQEVRKAIRERKAPIMEVLPPEYLKDPQWEITNERIYND